MCGVIVVDAESFRSTCHGHDAYVYDHCLGYCHNYVFFYQLLNSNLFTHHMLSSREKPLVKPMAPGLFLPYYFQIYKTKKIHKYLAAIYLLLPFYLSFTPISIRSQFANNREGIANPFVALGSSRCFCVKVLSGLLRCLLLD